MASARPELMRAADWIHCRVDLPPSPQHAATRAVVDWLGATLAGSVLDPVRIMRNAIVKDSAKGRSRLIPGGEMVNARDAALINGTASHAAEVDDIYAPGIYHPGAPTIAAAIAVGQSTGQSGREVLRAIVCGYEVSTRVAANIQPYHYQYWHTTGTVGTLGAAAAAASMLCEHPSQVLDALTTSLTLAAGLQQAFRSDAMSKPLHSGHAASAGVLAAALAGEGFTGAADVLEGSAGFGAAMGNDPEWSGIFEDLGLAYNIELTSVKAHACCGHTFAPIDGALELRPELDVGAIESIDVYTYGTALEVAGNPDPQTPFEAQFSIQYCVAAALLIGSCQTAAFAVDRIRDARLRSLMAKVSVHRDHDLEMGFPAKRAARIVVRVGDKELSAYRGSRRGDPDQPLTDDDLSAKFLALADPVVGMGRARGLLEDAWNMSDLPRVPELSFTEAG